MRASSTQRIVNDFKAALNAAARRYKAQLPPAFRDTVKDGLATVDAIAPVAREAQVLPDSDVRAIISAAGNSTPNADGTATSAASCLRSPRPARGFLKSSG